MDYDFLVWFGLALVALGISISIIRDAIKKNDFAVVLVLAVVLVAFLFSGGFRVIWA